MKVDIERVNEAWSLIQNLPAAFCKVCGETNPVGGFYPLYSSAGGSLSWLTCNPCMMEEVVVVKDTGG